MTTMILDEILEVCKTKNQFLQLPWGYELMVTDLSAEQQERLKELKCTYEWSKKGKFFAVRYTPEPPPQRTWRLHLLIVWLISFVGAYFYLSPELRRETWYFVEDLIY